MQADIFLDEKELIWYIKISESVPLFPRLAIAIGATPCQDVRYHLQGYQDGGECPDYLLGKPFKSLIIL
jgi:hypothetical protein